MSLLEKSRLGRYELLEVLGQGAMGVVYKAHDAFLDRIVAVKTYRKDIGITDEVKRRFEREVKTTSRLAHPNIVTVYDGGLEGDVPFLAMEYVEGSTLEAEIEKRGRLPVPEALKTILLVCEGLAYAHGHGVVHRDLKPANILVSAAGQLKIADFGVAKLASASTQATLTPVGTPSYMSPEQVAGKPIDARADVFSLGILSYSLLTGQQPFTGDTWTSVLFQIMNEEPPHPSDVAPELPHAVDQVIQRALAKSPAARTPSVSTFAAELRTAFAEAQIRTQPLPVEPPSRGEDFEGPLDTGDFGAFRDLSPRDRDRSYAGPVSAIVVLILVAGLGIFFLVKRGFLGTSEEVAMEGLVQEAPTAVPSPPPAPTPRPPAPTAAEPTLAPPPPPATVALPRPTVARVRPTAAPRADQPTRPHGVILAPPLPPPAVVPPPPREPPRESASVDVVSTPPGAEVLLNGAFRGRTPLQLSDLAPGQYDFEVRKPGFIPYRRTAELEQRSHYNMQVTLAPNLNSLRVLSQPEGAEVTVNGVVRGRAPVVLNDLENGTYEVKGRIEGYPSQGLSVELKGGQLKEVRFRFE